jgi:hypothetical protein
MAEIAESDKVLLAARLEASLGVASFGELSMRNGTFDALVEALRVSATGAAGKDAGQAVGVQRARRNSAASRLNSAFRHLPTRFAGYMLYGSGVLFLPHVAEFTGNAPWSPGQSGLCGDGHVMDDGGHVGQGAGAGAGAGVGAAALGAHAERNYAIVSLEEALIFVLLAALQVYVRGGKRCERDGWFDSDEVISVLKRETALAVGRSCIVGSLTEADLKRLLVPAANEYGGIADVLVVLSAWSRCGVALSAPVPPDWVMPPTPITDWPAAFTNPRGTLLVFSKQLPLVLAGIAEREMAAIDCIVREGRRGDGGMCITYGCLRRGPRLLGSDDFSLALDCPREVTFEVCVTAS